MRKKYFLFKFLIFVNLTFLQNNSFSNEEKIALEKINNRIMKIQKKEKETTDLNGFLIFFKNFNPNTNESEKLNAVVNQYISCELENMNLFLILKIRFNASFKWLRTAEDILYSYIKKFLKEYIKGSDDKFYEINPFFTVKIIKKEIMLLKYANDRFNINYLNQKSKKFYYDMCIVIEENISQSALKFFLFRILRELICSDSNKIIYYNFGLLASSAANKIFLEDDYKLLQNFIPKNAEEIIVRYRYGLENKFEYKITEDTDFTEATRYAILRNVIKNVLCEYLDQYNKTKIEIRFSLKEKFIRHHLHYKRDNLDHKKYRDNHYFELISLIQREKIKQVVIIKTDSKAILTVTNEINIKITYTFSLNIYKSTSHSPYIFLYSETVEDKNKFVKKIFKTNWLLTRDGCELSENNTNVELMNHENHLMFLENINNMIYIFTNDVIFFNLDKIIDTFNFKYEFYKHEKSFIFNKNTNKNEKLVAIINKFCKFNANDMSYLSINTFEFEYYPKSIYDNSILYYEDLKILKSYIVGIEVHNLFFVEMRCYKNIKKTKLNLENKVESLDKNILLFINISKKSLLVIVIRKLCHYKLDIDIKEKYYAEKIYNSINAPIFDPVPHVNYVLKKETDKILSDYKKFVWKTWKRVKFEILEEQNLDQIMLKFRDKDFNNFFEKLIKIKKGKVKSPNYIKDQKSARFGYEVNFSNEKYINIKILAFILKLEKEIRMVIKEILKHKEKFEYFLLSSFYVTS